MQDIGKAIAQLQPLRRKFEGLLEKARSQVGYGRQAASEANGLHELTGFGSNPGNLRLFVHVPERLPRDAPLVVALHGCSQRAAEYDRGTGWSALADRLGFAVLYPEQQPANNPNTCFSWFLPSDTARDSGEALSIRQMIEHAIGKYGIDRRRVFVTGLSAGGAMASVMLATYPEVFAGGAIIAGLPYGSARSVQQAVDAMFAEESTSAATLGDRVRAASSHRGPWPKISVWHGTADPIVNPSNGEAVVCQWLDVHDLGAAPSYQETVGGHGRRVWNDANGETLIEAFNISGMAHGVPLATDEGGYGAAGAFFLDAGISSTQRIADFWRLGEDAVAMPRAPAASLRPAPRAVVTAEQAMPGLGDANAIAAAANAPPEMTNPLDPNHAIAAAFRAAGLPVPTSAGAAMSPVDPAAIIAAALKAAGVRRS